MPDKTNKELFSPPNSWSSPENHLHSLLTNPWYSRINKLFSEVLALTHRFYQSRQISPTLFPITTGSVSSPMGLGSDSSPVKVSIKGNDVFLADSMQFSLEVGTRLNPRGAYYVMPSFRGENVDKRHLNEFVHSEVEIPGSLKDIQILAEDYIKYLIQGLLTTSASSIVDLAGDVCHLEEALNRSFYQIRYEDAVAELDGVEGCLDDSGLGYGIITSMGESKLIQSYGDFTWLTHMPWTMVPFYQAKEEGTSYSLTADLLGGIGEMLGSGQRVFSPEQAEYSLAFHKVSRDGYSWYIEMRKSAPLQTSGFGLGVERFLLWLLKHNDIRDCTLLLRDHKKVYFP